MSVSEPEKSRRTNNNRQWIIPAGIGLLMPTLAVLGFVVGSSGGMTLDDARQEGQKVGTASGTKRGYREGFKAAYSRAEKASYVTARNAAYSETVR